MGPSAPKQFTLKECEVVLRGLLPDISLLATEKEVGSEIASVIKSFEEDLASCTRFDFEFIEATGKSLCVPARQEGFKWTGRAVKNLAGNGQVYVRLVSVLGASSDSDSELPPAPVSRDYSHQPISPVSSPGVTVVKVEPPSHIGIRQSSLHVRHSSTSNSVSLPARGLSLDTGRSTSSSNRGRSSSSSTDLSSSSSRAAEYPHRSLPLNTGLSSSSTDRSSSYSRIAEYRDRSLPLNTGHSSSSSGSTGLSASLHDSAVFLQCQSRINACYTFWDWSQ